MATKTENYLRILAEGGDVPTSCCMTNTQAFIAEAARRVNALDETVQELVNNPDVTDIVATYAELQSYDTQSLEDGAIIRVLTDETHDNESSYYKWDSTNQSWTYIGSSSGSSAAIRNHTLYL